jgi:hypothetical protein
MSVQRRTSTGHVDLSFLRRRTSTGWTDLTFLRRRTSTGWVDIWPTEQSATYSFYADFGDAYRLPGVYASGWRDDNTVYYAGQSNNHKAYWFFGNTDEEGPGAGSTRTPTSGRLRLYAKNYFAGTRMLVLRPHNYLTRTAGEPAYMSGSISYNMPTQAWTWINLPSSWLSQILNGGMRGVGAYTTETSQYMEFSETARIEIEYDY